MPNYYQTGQYSFSTQNPGYIPQKQVNFGGESNNKTFNYTNTYDWTGVNISDSSVNSHSTYKMGNYNDNLHAYGSEQNITADLGGGYNSFSSGWYSNNSTFNIRSSGGQYTLLGVGHTFNINSGNNSDYVNIGSDWDDFNNTMTNYKGTINLAGGDNTVLINGSLRGNNLTFNALESGSNSITLRDYSLDDITAFKKIGRNMYELKDLKGNTYRINSAFKKIDMLKLSYNAQGNITYTPTTKTLDELDQLK